MVTRQRSIRREILQGLNNIPVFLDVESTGLSRSDEVVQIGIVNNHGKVLLDTYVMPTCKIKKGAMHVHHISEQTLRQAAAPPFPEILPLLKKALHGRFVWAYNSPFDWRMLRQSAVAHGLEFDIFPSYTQCAMRVYAEFYGERKGRSYRWQSLAKALSQQHVALPGEGALHSAAFDAEAMRRLLLTVAGVEI